MSTIKEYPKDDADADDWYPCTTNAPWYKTYKYKGFYIIWKAPGGMGSYTVSGFSKEDTWHLTSLPQVKKFLNQKIEEGENTK